MAISEKRQRYLSEYQKERREEWTDVFTLSKEDKIKMGLIKKPAIIRDLIHIVIPVHYGSHGVIWESRFVSKASLQGWMEQYPNLQIVEDELLLRR